MPGPYYGTHVYGGNNTRTHAPTPGQYYGTNVYGGNNTRTHAQTPGQNYGTHVYGENSTSTTGFEGWKFVLLLIMTIAFIIGGCLLFSMGFAFDTEDEDDEGISVSWPPGTDPTYYVMRHAGVGSFIIGLCFTVILSIYIARWKDALCEPHPDRLHDYAIHRRDFSYRFNYW